MTSLASQLAQRQQQTLDGARLSSQKALKHPPSFIYTPRFAATVSLADLHQTASSAWDQLQAIDSAFEKYQHRVLGEEARRTDRSALSKDENDKLGAALDNVLRLLGKHLLLKPAGQVLEWLIRRFRVNDLNVPALIGMSLPYHTTPHFPSALALINEQTLQASDFAPLVLARKSLQPVALDEVVAQFPPFSTNNSARAFMEHIIRLPISYLEQAEGKAHRALVAFWLQAVASYLDRAGTRLPSGERTAVLACLLDTLKLSKEHPDVLVATYILLARFAMHFPFDGQTLRVVLKSIVSNKARKEVGDEETDAAFVTTLVVLSQLATGDIPVSEGKKFLGGSGWKALMRVENLSQLLLQLSHQYNAARFMKPFLGTLTSEALQSSEAADLFSSLLQPSLADASLVLPDSVISIVIDAAIDAILQSPQELDPAPVLKGLMQVYQRWPAVWESTTAAWVQKTTDTDDLSLLWSILNTVVGGKVVAGEPSTMFLSATSSDVAVRAKALQDIIASHESLLEGNPTFLREILISRLSEPVLEVAQVILSQEAVAVVHEVLTEDQIFAALRSNLATQPSAAVLDVVLPYLAGPFVAKYPAFMGDVVKTVYWSRLLSGRTHAQERVAAFKALKGSIIDKQHGWIKGVGKAFTLDIDSDGVLQNGSATNDKVADTVAKNIAALAGEEQVEATSFVLDSLHTPVAGQISAELDLTIKLTSLFVSVKLLAKLDKTARLGFAFALFNRIRGAHITVDSLTGAQPEGVLDEQGSLAPVVASAVFSKPSAFKTVRRVEAAALLASIATLQPLKGCNWKWLTIELSDETGQYIQLAHSVYAFAHTGSTPGGRALATLLLRALFTRMLLDDSLAFFASLYTSTTQPSELQIAALNDAKTFVRAQHLPEVAKPVDYQAVLPSVLVALQSSNKKMRNAALELLAVFESNAPPNIKTVYGRDHFYGASSEHLQYLDAVDVKAYMAKMLASRTEISMDGAFLTTLHQSLLDPKDGEGAKKRASLRFKVVVYLMSHVMSWQSLFARTSLLRALAGVTDQNKSSLVIPVLQRMIESPFDERAELSTTVNQTMLEEFSTLLVQPFSGASRKWIESTDNKAFDTLKGVLALEDETGLGAMLRAKTLQIVAAGLFKTLRGEQRLEIYKLLVRLTTMRTARIVADLIKTLNACGADTETLTSTLKELRLSMVSPVSKSSKRGRTSIGGSSTSTTDSKLGRVPELVAVLETVEFATLEPTHDLLLSLFDLLTSVNDVSAAAQAEVQYTGQLLLSALLQSVDRVSPSSSVTGDSIRMSPVLDLMRTSQNPQICQQALLLLAKLGPLVPDQLVHNIMPIFTFMGANVLQRDDAYSMRVVESTLENIVPSLVKSTKRTSGSRAALVLDLKELLRIFADAANHMPRHRRARMFVKFVETLGPQDFLSAVTMLLVDKDVKSAEGAPLAVVVMETFSVEMQLTATKQILSEVSALLEGSGGLLSDAGLQTDGPADSVLTLLAFVTELLETRQMVAKVDAARAGGNDEIDPTLAGLVRDLLDLSSPKDSALSEERRQEIAQAASYGVHATVTLMSTKSFAEAILWLLDLSDETIQVRALELLRSKLATVKPTRRADISASVVSVIERIRPQLAQTGVDVGAFLETLDNIVSSPFTDEDAVLAKLVPELISLATSSQADLAKQLQATAIIDKLTRRLGPRLIPLVAKLVPFAIGLFRDRKTAPAGLRVLEGLLSSIPTFIGGQLDKIFAALVSDELVDKGAAGPVSKARASLISTAAKKLPSKTLFSAIVRLHASIDESEQAPLLSVLDVLNRSLRQAKAPDVLETYRPIFKMFLSVFDLRRKQVALDDINLVESNALGAFIQFILKLNEQTFRPLFLRTYDWAVIDLAEAEDAEDAITARRIVLYKLVDRMLAQLKSIFVPYYSFMLEQTTELLTSFAEDVPDDVTLWTCVIKSLTKALEYDDTGFWTAARLSKLSNPIANQVELIAVKHDDDEVRVLFGSLVHQFSLASSSHEQVLKSFNTQLLMTTRSDDLVVKRQALLTLDDVWDALGDTMLTFVPETTPFLSETLDETQGGVDKATRRLIKRIEEHLGESLASYLEM
ncbi:snoRNA-binding rRNA-processing protein utp10 [Microbotryomycetes sp. JL201]|nr:snoRNA-binding rRNA-processing protein utp10 [Microbotryomycetes sp. JL201]